MDDNVAIKYVTIELLMSDTENPSQIFDDKERLVYGLLNGIKTNYATTKSTFISVKTSDDVIELCSTDVYNIVSLEIYNGQERDITFFKSHEDDQKVAFGMVTNVVEELKKEGRTAENGDYIKIDTYSDVPKDLTTSPAVSVGSAVKTTTTNTASKSIGAVTGNTSTSSNTSYNAKKEPALIKRTTKKPTKIALEKMKQAVMAISEGTHVPNIPKIKGDDEEEKKEETKTTAIGNSIYTDDEEENYFGYC
jgi:hypothetical protein